MVERVSRRRNRTLLARERIGFNNKQTQICLELVMHFEFTALSLSLSVSLKSYRGMHRRRKK
jgi:hypothetical protein